MLASDTIRVEASTITNTTTAPRSATGASARKAPAVVRVAVVDVTVTRVARTEPMVVKAGRKVKHYEGGPMPWTGSFSHIYVQLGWPPFNPTTWVSAEPTIPGLPLGHDVVDHGVPASVAMPEMGANGAGPHRMGMMLPSGMNPRGAGAMPRARLGGWLRW